MLDENKAYFGPENRSGEDRRSHHDRREMIRFEPDKEDRRSITLRRKLKSVWDDGRSRY